MNDITSLRTILGVWAHPDDETYLSAGLMALARDAGQRVVCVTATRGEHGTDNPVTWPSHRLAALRERELAAALTALGVHGHHWLGYEDGTLARQDVASGTQHVAAIIEAVHPDTIVTSGQTGSPGIPITELSRRGHGGPGSKPLQPHGSSKRRRRPATPTGSRRSMRRSQSSNPAFRSARQRITPLSSST